MCMVYIYFYINPLWRSTIIILQLMDHCACYIAYIRMQLLLNKQTNKYFIIPRHYTVYKASKH